MISATEYKTISDDIGLSYQRSFDILNYLEAAYSSMLPIRTDSTYSFASDDARAALLVQSRSYRNERTGNPTIALNTVGALQRHVETHYGSVNGFLSNNGIKVNEFFAILSEEVGYEIDSGNIE